MDYKTSKISLSLLEFDLENFRFPEKLSQQKSLEVIINSKNAKTLGLIKSISEHGYFEDEPLYVAIKNGKNIVMEGNRRLAALKVLTNPDLVRESPYYQNIKKYSTNSKILPSLIPCVIYENLKKCLERIQLRHGNKNKGAGKIDWDTIQKDRAERRNGLSIPALDLIEFIFEQNWVPVLSLEEFENEGIVRNYTTLKRIFGNKEAQNYLGINSNNYLYSDKFPEEIYNTILKDLFFIIIVGQTSVEGMKYNSRRLNTTPQIISFLTKLDNSIKQGHFFSKEENFSPNIQNNKKKTVTEDIKTQVQLENKKLKAPDFKRGKFLVSEDFDTEIIGKHNHKVADIFKELKKLEVESFNNVSAVMIRIALEMTIDCYIERNHFLSTISTKSPEPLLIEKLNFIIAKIKEANNNKENSFSKVLHYIRSNEEYPFYFRNLHFYLHNPHINPPTPQTLIKAWSSINEVVKRIWRGEWDKSAEGINI